MKLFPPTRSFRLCVLSVSALSYSFSAYAQTPAPAHHHRRLLPNQAVRPQLVPTPTGRLRRHKATSRPTKETCI
jgi:hypothetical protein